MTNPPPNVNALMGVNVVYIILASGVVGIVCALTGKGKKHAA